MDNEDIEIVTDIVLEEAENTSSTPSPEPTPIVIYIDEEGRAEATQYYMTTCENVNNFLADVSPKVDIIFGSFQLLLAFLVVFLVYKLFNFFF